MTRETRSEFPSRGAFCSGKIVVSQGDDMSLLSFKEHYHLPEGIDPSYFTRYSVGQGVLSSLLDL